MIINEIHRILIPGGYLCFAEPHSNSIFDIFRNIWYKYDKYFEINERSIDYNVIKREYNLKFDFLKEEYIGNFAYLFVLNSLIWRIPLNLKKFYSPILLYLESFLQIFHSKYFSCLVISRWKKYL